MVGHADANKSHGFAILMGIVDALRCAPFGAAYIGRSASVFRLML